MKITKSVFFGKDNACNYKFFLNFLRILNLVSLAINSLAENLGKI